MVVLTFVGIADNIPNDLVVELRNIIENATGEKIIEAYQMTGKEITAIAVDARKSESTHILQQNVEKISLKEIESAIKFLTTNFGDPRDSVDAFRVRVNKILYGNSTSSTTRKRLMACIEVFSRLHMARAIPGEVIALINDNGFYFMMEWSSMILRFKDM